MLSRLALFALTLAMWVGGPATAKAQLSLEVPSGCIGYQPPYDEWGYEQGYFLRFGADGEYKAPLDNECLPLHLGDKIVIREFDPQSERSFVVPLLEASVDRATDIVSGRATPYAAITITVSSVLDYNGPHSSPKMLASRVIKANAKGAFGTDFTGTVNIIGNHKITVSLPTGTVDREGRRDEVYSSFTVPHVLIRQHLGIAEVTLLPNTLASLELRSPTGTVVSQTRVLGDYDGRTQIALWRNASGGEAETAGNLMVADFANDARLLLPKVELRAHPATNTVTGRCVPHGTYVAQVSVGRGSTLLRGRASADGSFTHNTAHIATPLHRASWVLCRFGTGDLIRKDYPYLP